MDKSHKDCICGKCGQFLDARFHDTMERCPKCGSSYIVLYSLFVILAEGEHGSDWRAKLFPPALDTFEIHVMSGGKWSYPSHIRASSHEVAAEQFMASHSLAGGHPSQRLRILCEATGEAKQYEARISLREVSNFDSSVG